MKKIIFPLFAIGVLLSCNKDPETEFDSNLLIGDWVYEYQIMSDGTHNFDNPYALLEFEYSDGFILKGDGTGNSVWNGILNEDFEWTSDGSQMTISPTDVKDIFEYKISDLQENSMIFESPSGYRYQMIKN